MHCVFCCMLNNKGISQIKIKQHLSEEHGTQVNKKHITTKYLNLIPHHGRVHTQHLAQNTMITCRASQLAHTKSETARVKSDHHNTY